MAKFNRYVTNRLIGPIAPWVPGLGVVYHRGRKSGRCYHNPIIVFRQDRGFVVALTYGSQSDWVKNVLAAGECDLRTRGRRYHLINPTIYVDAQRRDLPAPIRTILTMTNVTEFLSLRVAPTTSD